MPLVVSNPVLFPQPVQTDALASLKARMAAANLSPIPPLIFMPSVAKAAQT